MTFAGPGFTPIRIQFLPESLITWMDLRDVRFEEPFFRDTIDRVSQAGPRPMALSGIEELQAQDHRPTLAPSLFIFHASRCGSTLVSQILATIASNVVIAEASVINDLLATPLAEAEKSDLLRLLIRALGRDRPGDARHLIVKFSSWNVLSAEMIHRAFPDTPLVWLQREPLQIVASHAEQPAGWTGWRDAGDPALSMLGLTVAAARALSAAQFRLHAIEALFRAAHRAKLAWQTVDYAELPGAVWGEIAAHARLSWDPSDLERMQARARFDSRSSSAVPYLTRDRSRSLSDEDRRFVATWIAPLYRALGHQEPKPDQLPNSGDDGGTVVGRA